MEHKSHSTRFYRMINGQHPPDYFQVKRSSERKNKLRVFFQHVETKTGSSTRSDSMQRDCRSSSASCGVINRQVAFKSPVVVKHNTLTTKRLLLQKDFKKLSMNQKNPSRESDPIMIINGIGSRLQQKKKIEQRSSKLFKSGSIEQEQAYDKSI